MPKPCNWCKLPLFWYREDDGTRTPYEDEALTIRHDCPKKPGTGPPPAMKPPRTQPIEAPQEKPPPKTQKVAALTDEEILFLRKFRHWCKELAP
jgi:hypothetical protein